MRLFRRKKQAKVAPEYLIELDHLERWFGWGDAQTRAVSQVDLKIKKGEFVAIMGPSGCGKTTLLNIIGLLDHSSGGDYLLNGQLVSRLSSRQKAKIRNRQIGFIFQDYNLIPRLPIIENVALPLLYAGQGKTRRLKRASQILAKFNLQNREYYMPWQLSGGQIQRVAIARALVNQPLLILADEPTGAVDSYASHVIMEELYSLHQEGHTIIMVTHNQDLTSYATRVIRMLDGKIVEDFDNNLGAVNFYPRVTLSSRVDFNKSYFKPKSSAKTSTKKPISIVKNDAVKSAPAPRKQIKIKQEEVA